MPIIIMIIGVFVQAWGHQTTNGWLVLLGYTLMIAGMMSIVFESERIRRSRR